MPFKKKKKEGYVGDLVSSLCLIKLRNSLLDAKRSDRGGPYNPLRHSFSGVCQ